MIELINNLNKEANSIVAIKKDNQIIPLTEKELEQLVNSIYFMRPDAFQSLPESSQVIKQLESDYNDLKSDYEDLKAEYEELDSEFEEYKILNDEYDN